MLSFTFLELFGIVGNLGIHCEKLKTRTNVQFSVNRQYAWLEA